MDRIVTGHKKDSLAYQQKKKIDIGYENKKTGEHQCQHQINGLHPQKSFVLVDMKGVIHYELLENITTITSDFYCQQHDWLYIALRFLLIKRKIVIFMDGNASVEFRM